MKPSMIQQNGLTTTSSSSSSITFRNTNLLVALRGGEAPLLTSPMPSRFDPLIQKLIPGRHEQHANIFAAIVLAILLKPAAKIYYEQLSLAVKLCYEQLRIKCRWNNEKQRDDEDGLSVVGATSTEQQQQTWRTFDGSKFYRVIETIVQAARLLLVVAAFDIFKTIILCLGVRLPKTERLTDVFAWGVYLLWGFRRIGAFKFYLLKKITAETDIINDPRRLYVINRLTDYGLIFFGIFAFYEVTRTEMGYSAKSLVAALSVGTAAFALATKEILTNFLNGIILSASDRIYKGDFISINGEVKKVNRLGWLETALRGSDNILYTVPNTELVSTKLSNLSRVNTCQVRQTLRFPYNCMEKLPKLTQDIKNEIRLACPLIITDGSHPFRCYWINFDKKELEVFVNAHFRIPPVGDAYYENRQRCLLAIDRAIRKNEIDGYSGSR